MQVEQTFAPFEQLHSERKRYKISANVQITFKFQTNVEMKHLGFYALHFVPGALHPSLDFALNLLTVS